MDSTTAITARAAEVAASGESTARPGRDPVNRPMINSWSEALGFDPDPGGPVPPAMIQVWTMLGLRGVRAPDDPLNAMMDTLDAHGYTSVVATDCRQIYHHPLEVGDAVTVTTELESVVGPKRTALGEGWFVTTRNRWYRDRQPMAEMLFRVLKFAPGAVVPAPSAAATDLLPVMSPDTHFFWEGTAKRELRLQRLADGSLRHPPVPRVDTDPAADVDHVVASGRGVVHSYVVHHHPPVPGRRTPFVVALVDLEEGPRMLGELRGVEGDQVRIGMRVTVDFEARTEEVAVPFWRVADTSPEGRRLRGAPTVGMPLPPWVIHADPTFVVSTALATRDFQDVHHDRDKAIARGSTDIFVNILTDTGVVQRFVERWAGPGARFRSIALRLGVPWYAGDTVTVTGAVTGVDADLVEVSVVGSNSLGRHVTGTVTVEIDTDREEVQ